MLTKIVDGIEVKCTAKEEKAIRDGWAAADADPAIANMRVIAKIEQLEATQARSVRDAILSGDMTKLKEIDDNIAVLRDQLVT